MIVQVALFWVLAHLIKWVLVRLINAGLGRLSSSSQRSSASASASSSSSSSSSSSLSALCLRCSSYIYSALSRYFSCTFLRRLDLQLNGLIISLEYKFPDLNPSSSSSSSYSSQQQQHHHHHPHRMVANNDKTISSSSLDLDNDIETDTEDFFDYTNNSSSSSSSSSSRWFSIAQLKPQLRQFYSLGAVLVSVANIAGPIFLLKAIYGLLIPSPDLPTFRESLVEAPDLLEPTNIVTPIIPGLNYPWQYALEFWLCSLVAMAVHETGHYVAALVENVAVPSCGILFAGMMPGAYVNVAEEPSVSLSLQARIR